MADHSLVLVHDQPQPCPYLEHRTARMPLQWPTQGITPESLDRFMAAGYRRSGLFLYRTECRPCRACQPTRVPVDRFELTRSMRRVLKRGDQRLRVQLRRPTVDDHRLKLLNRHRTIRRLDVTNGELDITDYHSFLVDTCCDTRELVFWLGDQIVAVAVTDFGIESLSAVYCYFDPEISHLSPGTYSILKHIELARSTGRRFVYLGMYVSENSHLNYKARFQPQQRLVEGQWVEASDDPTDGGSAGNTQQSLPTEFA